MRTLQAPPEASPFARHVPALDGVRGLAALGVVVSHVFPGQPHGIVSSIAKHIASMGACGVDLFFALSGFLITGILYDSLADHAFFRKFYARRALRIFPLYYGVLAAFAIAALLLHLNFHRQLLSLALYMQNNYLVTVPIFKYTGPTALPLSHFWSLAIEEQFYLVWPVAVFLLRKNSRLLVCCAVFLIACPILRIELYRHGISYIRIHEATLTRVDTLLAGAALALLLRSRFHDTALRAAPWLFLAGVIAFFLPGLFAHRLAAIVSWPTFWALDGSFGSTALAVASTGLIALTLHTPAVERLFSLAALRWLGKYSYGIYVFHLILFTYLEIPLRLFLRARIAPNKELSIVLTGLICLALTVLAAYLSYNLYERRFLRLKRFFDYRLHPDTVA